MGGCTLLLKQQGCGPPNLMYKYMHMYYQLNNFESVFQSKDSSPVMSYPQPLHGKWIKNPYPIPKTWWLYISVKAYFSQQSMSDYEQDNSKTCYMSISKWRFNWSWEVPGAIDGVCNLNSQKEGRCFYEVNSNCHHHYSIYKCIRR